METLYLPMHFKLYKDGELVAAYTQGLTLPSDNYICMGSGPFPWRVGMQYMGEYVDGWRSFRTTIDGADGSRYTEMLPFLVYDRPAQFPSVLVAPCRWQYEPGFPPPPKVFVLTAQCVDPLKERADDAHR